MIQILTKNTKYDGKYVALKSFDKQVVIGKGSTPQEAYDKAISKGYSNPVITFIPAKGMVQIY
jgi:hypothetical protein